MSVELPPDLAGALAEPPRPQRAFSWKPAGWRTEMHDLPEVLEVLEALPDKVDRTLIRETVLAELAAGRVLPAFVSAMVWGYGDAGYGATRVRWVLTGIKDGAHGAPVRSDVAGLLGVAVNRVRAEGPVEGFRFMSNAGRIKHLASAFFTKWLYFSSALASPDDPNAAPILDKRVHDWLEDRANLTLDISRTHEYQRYLDALTSWGEAFGRTAVQVEKAIFGLATGRD
ncbi:hypothetical protein [Mycobacterium sp. TY815]|uniref:8-oxoguanine DNA glycosylase OGG fold protein n=1 Tax=Mycobacterium sp. TY815 TaxID=3050581 RepID=UPI0027429187|nr:hypothetical protein [Mycobacterium sp. TY815]MDP7707445.1 hypothetical protein [Mycobacterium sp. TY815]